MANKTDSGLDELVRQVTGKLSADDWNVVREKIDLHYNVKSSFDKVVEQAMASPNYEATLSRLKTVLEEYTAAPAERAAETYASYKKSGEAYKSNGQNGNATQDVIDFIYKKYARGKEPKVSFDAAQLYNQLKDTVPGIASTQQLSQYLINIRTNGNSWLKYEKTGGKGNYVVNVKKLAQEYRS
jgi:hypothetical protein